MRLKREEGQKTPWVPYIYIAFTDFSSVLMSLVILLTSVVNSMNSEGGYYNTFSSVTINGKESLPLKSNYETQTSVDGMSDWNKDKYPPQHKH